MGIGYALFRFDIQFVTKGRLYRLAGGAYFPYCLEIAIETTLSLAICLVIPVMRAPFFSDFTQDF